MLNFLKRQSVFRGSFFYNQSWNQWLFFFFFLNKKIHILEFTSLTEFIRFYILVWVRHGFNRQKCSGYYWHLRWIRRWLDTRPFLSVIFHWNVPAMDWHAVILTFSWNPMTELAVKWPKISKLPFLESCVLTYKTLWTISETWPGYSECIGSREDFFFHFQE